MYCISATVANCDVLKLQKELHKNIVILERGGGLGTLKHVQPASLEDLSMERNKEADVVQDLGKLSIKI